MPTPDIPPERKSLHNAQRSIVQAYADLADMMQLPEKEAKPLPDEEALIASLRRSTASAPAPRATAAARAATASDAGRSRWWLPAMAIALVAVVMGARFALAPGRELPPQLLGSWATSNPAFAGREIEFTADSLVLRNVLTSPSRHRIDAVTLGASDGATHVKIKYEAAGSAQLLEIVLGANGAKEFSLVRPKGVVWHRAG